MNNPFMKRAGLKDSGNTSEVRLAKSLAARLQPVSGALRGAKSDMKKSAGNFKFRIEAKTTQFNKLSIEAGWLVKISNEASADGSIPTLIFSFVDENGKPRLERNSEWVCMPKVFFQSILEDLEEISYEGKL